jgi:GNAT superfamily N-acetyltransferase
MAYRNSSLDMPGRIAQMRTLCAGEPGPGVLAYVNGQTAGWCSVAPKTTYRALVNSRTIPHVQDEGAWSVVCFVVRPGFRRRGLMHQLLDGGVGHAHAMGAIVLEGYPVDPGSERVDQTAGYAGTVPLVEADGFSRVCQTAGHSGGQRPEEGHVVLAPAAFRSCSGSDQQAEVTASSPSGPRAPTSARARSAG